MNFKYIQNQTESSASIFLFSPIGGGGIDAQQFVNELQFLDGLGLDEINIHINSGGGSVIDGFGIFAAIRAAKTPVNTIIEGIAASIAGIIAMAGVKRTMADFGRLMVHDPSFGGKAKPSAKDKAILDTIKASLITILSNNSSLDEGAIFDLMTEETWFSADEAKAFGFIDDVFTTKRKKEEVVNLDVNGILNIVNESNLKPIKKDMVNVINHLGLTEGVEENVVLDAIKVLEDNVLNADVKVEEMENTITTLTTEHATALEGLNNTIVEKDAVIIALNKELATVTVENAINAGKFSKDKKAELINTAEKDLNAFKAIIEAVNVAPVSITNLIDTTTTEPTEVTFNEMSKNDPKGLLNLMKNDFPRYSTLYKKQFGVEPTK